VRNVAEEQGGRGCKSGNFGKEGPPVENDGETV